jgi:NAD(P)-dependent dehydrogenase (short-subunit alcohol dehydrogenase family)
MKNKHVLLTGGAGGLGLGVTPTVLTQGVQVTIAYVQAGEVERSKRIFSHNTTDCCSSLNRAPLPLYLDIKVIPLPADAFDTLLKHVAHRKFTENILC